MRTPCFSARIAVVTAVAVLCAGAALGFGRITARNGDVVTLSVGSRDGVEAGMSGDVVKVVEAGGQAQPTVIASFVVTEVGERSSRARLERIQTGFDGDPMQGLPVAFDRPLKKPEAAGPAAQATPPPSTQQAPAPNAPAAPPPATQGTPPANPTPQLSGDPVQLLNQAGAAWDRQEWERAAELYEALLRVMPDDPMAVKRAAAARAKVQAAQAALAQERTNLPVYREKAKAFLDAGNWNAAVEWLQRIAAADPNDAYLASVVEGRRHDAERALAEGRFDDAVRECEAALAVSAPPSPAIKALLGQARAGQVKRWLAEGDGDLARGDVPAARAAWDRVAAVDPHNAGLDERLTKLDWVRIPAGTFEMGCVPADVECAANEKPRHAVTIDTPFLMMIRPVTVAQYRRFVQSTGRAAAPAPAFAQGDDHPVVGVDWNDAVAYCSWAGGRLPTEAEWEYAARGGQDGLKYPWGNSISHENANFKGTGGRDQWKYTSPVGSFDANGFGLFDMAGNVWEWCADPYGETYYASSPSVDPQGPPSGSSRVLRGGSWDFDPKSLRASFRGWILPWGGCDSGGFRCVRPAP
ncbi:MAG: SUMF1/EgtB/PvdO family nonheme iron enzyme [Thermoanaerobaculaceae bacterium]|nr:SUMF1/EgtB/PvdO family nonheme iron enzyme [Thermoanaerobaculaceae bacterium]